MCGRFAFEAKKSLKSKYKLKLVVGSLESNYNISPGQNVPVIINTEKGNELIDMKWGLKLPFGKISPFNSRSETVVEKPFFRRLLGTRCIIPAIGFYEWDKITKSKKKYLIRMKHEDYLSLAGIYNTFKDENGKEKHSVSILTTNPNKVLESIHDRMPVIISPKDEDKWLSSNNLDEFLPLMKPYDAKEMESFEVSNKKVSFHSADSTLIDPL